MDEDGPWTVVVTYRYHADDCNADAARRAVGDAIAGRSTAKDDNEYDLEFLAKTTVVHPAGADPFDDDTYFESTNEGGGTDG